MCVGLLPLCGPQRVFRRSSRVSLVVRPNLPLPLCNGAPPRSYSFDDARLLTSIGLNTSRACRQLLPSDGLLAFLGFASLSCSSGVTSLVLFLRSHFLPGLHGFLPFHLRPSLGRVSPPLPLPLYSCPLFGYKVDTRKNAASRRTPCSLLRRHPRLYFPMCLAAFPLVLLGLRTSLSGLYPRNAPSATGRTPSSLNSFSALMVTSHPTGGAYNPVLSAKTLPRPRFPYSPPRRSLPLPP